MSVRLEPEKHKHADSTNVALGVDADLSAAASGRRIIFKPTSGWTEFILDTLQKAKKDNCPGAYFGCDTAVTQPLVQRASRLSASRASGKGTFPFTCATELMLQFFIALFRDLPPLVIHLGNHLRKKMPVYTDVSFAKKHDDNRVRRKGLGVIVVGCENVHAYRSSLPCPDWLLNLFEARKT